MFVSCWESRYFLEHGYFLQHGHLVHKKFEEQPRNPLWGSTKQAVRIS